MNPLNDPGFLLENLLSNTSDSIYFKDLDSRFIMVNPACAKKHKWPSPESVKGKSDFDTFTKEHAEQAYADEQRVIETGEPLRAVEERETWPDGSVTWASTTKIPLRNEQGKIIGIFGISRDITERKEAELRARRYADEMNVIKEEMEYDVRMAGRLQKNFAPNGYPNFPEGADADGQCIDFLHRFNLRRQVTGDYCTIFRVSDHHVGIFLCDVCGVGLRAALGTALIRGIMREISALGMLPGAYLARMNQLLVPLLNQENLVLDVTACYLVFDVRTGTVQVANAGHPMPIHFRDGYAAQWLCDSDDCVGEPLAVKPDSTYVVVERQLSPEDSVVMFTDGLYTVKNNVDDEYGKKRLLDSGHSLAGEPLADIFQGLEDDALAFAHDGNFVDDVCMVGFRFNKPMEDTA